MRRRERQLVFAAASVLLDYPGADLATDLAAVRSALDRLAPGSVRSHLERTWKALSAVTALEAASCYVDAFDLTRKRTLHLSYYRYGDTRERGLALAAMAEEYQRLGYLIGGGELPDYLPALLELAAAHDDGERLLGEHRSAIQALRDGLDAVASPYTGAVAALSVALGPLSSADQRVLARLRSDGAPSEAVGLEPYAPPEFITQGITRR